MQEHNRHPDAALPRVFHLEDARAAGVTVGQLRGSRFVRLGRGIYRQRALPFHSLEVYAAFCAANPDAHLSHVSAAHAWGLWLPPRITAGFPVHLSTAGPQRNSPRQVNVVGHWSRIPPDFVREVNGLRLSSPAWTWTQLAGSGLGLPDLVAAGDALLQRSDGAERPPNVIGANPLATRDEVFDVLEMRKRFPGKRLALQAVSMLREGVDSRPESIVRQDLVKHRWPEPVVNFHLQTRCGVRAIDLAYPDQRIAIQYEGRHHNSSEQLSRDILRDAELEEIDWLTVRTDKTYFSDPNWGGFYDRLRTAFARRKGTA
ncbi:hypothetical protein [Zhihengliuella flava]|uniref:Very-short-patch-repair endonuclease n=1 Tax=Zhihengliuella flava TaxID=1285193 RepID=A0A931GFK0_9MICC|nr:hypothetical protein [Zhihengliuella flava]MBG6085458.1 very-short-patch-repair endonuclease [Zhihengliuella flava]